MYVYVNNDNTICIKIDYSCAVIKQVKVNKRTKSSYTSKF